MKFTHQLETDSLVALYCSVHRSISVCYGSNSQLLVRDVVAAHHHRRSGAVLDYFRFKMLDDDDIHTHLLLLKQLNP